MDVVANKKIGAELKKLRKRNGLKQGTVAERLRKPQSYISKVESGEKSLHLYEVFTYADAIDIPRGVLLGTIEHILTGRTTVIPARTEYASIDLPEENIE